MLTFFILPSCSPNYLKDYTEVEETHLNRPAVFDHSFLKVTYKTNLTVMGNQLTGILLIKKTKDEEYRFVFLSEIGLKYFDLGINDSSDKQEFTTHYLMPALNRGETKNILFSDFSKLIASNLPIGNTAYYKQTKTGNIALKYNNSKSVYIFDAENKTIESILWKNSITGKSEIILSDYNTKNPEKIEIRNKKYSLRMEMKEIIKD